MRRVTPGEVVEDREKYWQQRITEARKYPGGIAKYCRDHDIGKELYYHWFGKLKSKVGEWQAPLNTNEKRRKRPPKVQSLRQADQPRRKREWLALIEEAKESGLSLKQFAKRKHINPVTFCRWFKKLAGQELPEHTMRKSVDHINPSADAEDDFVPVKVIESASAPERDNACRRSPIEIVLVSGRIIRAQEDCAVDFLRTLISIAEEP